MILFALSGILAVTVPPNVDFPEKWQCKIEEVIFEPGHKCQPTKVITYCSKEHRTYLDTFKMKAVGVCLPVKREEIDFGPDPEEAL